jgi:hypothetical protein
MEWVWERANVGVKDSTLFSFSKETGSADAGFFRVGRYQISQLLLVCRRVYVALD